MPFSARFHVPLFLGDGYVCCLLFSCLSFGRVIGRLLWFLSSYCIAPSRVNALIMSDNLLPVVNTEFFINLLSNLVDAGMRHSSFWTHY